MPETVERPGRKLSLGNQPPPAACWCWRGGACPDCGGMTQALSSLSLVLTRVSRPPADDECFARLSDTLKELDGSLKRLRVRPRPLSRACAFPSNSIRSPTPPPPHPPTRLSQAVLKYYEGLQDAHRAAMHKLGPTRSPDAVCADAHTVRKHCELELICMAFAFDRVNRIERAVAQGPVRQGVHNDPRRAGALSPVPHPRRAARRGHLHRGPGRLPCPRTACRRHQCPCCPAQTSNNPLLGCGELGWRGLEGDPEQCEQLARGAAHPVSSLAHCTAHASRLSRSIHLVASEMCTCKHSPHASTARGGRHGKHPLGASGGPGCRTPRVWRACSVRARRTGGFSGS